MLFQQVFNSIPTEGFFEKASQTDFWTWLSDNNKHLITLPMDTELLNDYMGMRPRLTDFGSFNSNMLFPIVGCTRITTDEWNNPAEISIEISDTLSDSYQRWTLAHIYAHFLLGHWKDYFSGFTEGEPFSEITLFETTATIDVNNKDPMEQECNDCAIQLLLPESILKTFLYNAPKPEFAYIAAGVPYEVLEAAAKKHKIKLCAQKGPTLITNLDAIFQKPYNNKLMANTL